MYMNKLAIYQEEGNTEPVRRFTKSTGLVGNDLFMRSFEVALKVIPRIADEKKRIAEEQALLHSKGIIFTQSQPQIWEILYKQQNYTVTFYPDVYDEKPSLRLINFCEPLFEELLSAACKIFEYKRTNFK